MIFWKYRNYRKYQKYHDIFVWKYHDTIMIYIIDILMPTRGCAYVVSEITTMELISRLHTLRQQTDRTQIVNSHLKLHICFNQAGWSKRCVYESRITQTYADCDISYRCMHEDTDRRSVFKHSMLLWSSVKSYIRQEPVTILSRPRPDSCWTDLARILWTHYHQ